MIERHVQLTSLAVHDLNKVPAQAVPAVIEFLFYPLAATPTCVAKPLAGELVGLFGARRGEYRVLYEASFESSTVEVHRVAHRSDAYRPLDR